MLGRQPRPQPCSRWSRRSDVPVRLHFVGAHWPLGSSTKIVSHARRPCRPRICIGDMALLGQSGIVPRHARPGRPTLWGRLHTARIPRCLCRVAGAARQVAGNTATRTAAGSRSPIAATRRLLRMPDGHSMPIRDAYPTALDRIPPQRSPDRRLSVLSRQITGLRTHPRPLDARHGHLDGPPIPVRPVGRSECQQVAVLQVPDDGLAGLLRVLALAALEGEASGRSR